MSHLVYSLVSDRQPAHADLAAPPIPSRPTEREPEGLKSQDLWESRQELLIELANRLPCRASATSYFQKVGDHFLSRIPGCQKFAISAISWGPRSIPVKLKMSSCLSCFLKTVFFDITFKELGVNSRKIVYSSLVAHGLLG